VKLLAGKISCLIGIIFAIVGVLATFFGYGASIAIEAVGVVFGILCVAALFFGVVAGQGLIPGFEGYGRQN
jgi:hypothetical protein